MAVEKFPNFKQGETLVFDITVTDEDTGAAKDISNWVYTVTIKTALSDPDGAAVLQHVVTMPADATSQAGLGEIKVPSNKTSALTPGTYFADIQRKIAGAPPDIRYIVPATKIQVYEPVTKTFS